MFPLGAVLKRSLFDEPDVEIVPEIVVPEVDDPEPDPEPEVLVLLVELPHPIKDIAVSTHTDVYKKCLLLFIITFSFSQ